MQHAHLHIVYAESTILLQNSEFWGVFYVKNSCHDAGVCPSQKKISQVGETSFGNELYVHGPAFQLTAVVAAFFSDLEKDERHERNISVNEFFLYTFFLDA